MMKSYMNLSSGIITGSTGFLGSNLLNNLAPKFNLVSTCKRGRNGLVWDVSTNNFPNLGAINLDFLIHSAALISGGKKQYSDIISVNILGTLRTLEFAMKKKIKKYIYISSVPVIGQPRVLPITESHFTEPNTIYHSSKLAGEHICRQFGLEQNNMHIYILRIPSPIGINMRSDTFLSTLLHNARNSLDIKIEGQGLRRQTYVDVRDLSNVIEFILLNEVTPGIYNVCPDRSISNIDLARTVNDMFGNRSSIFTDREMVESDSIFWDVDNSKIINEIGGYEFFDIKSSLEYLSENCFF